MSIIIDSRTLREGFNKIITVIDKRNSRPILTNSLINIANNKLELIATDLEVSAKIVLDAITTEDTSFCINTKNISDILRELPDRELTLNIDKDKNLLNLKCDSIEYSLLITSSEDFPKINFTNSHEVICLKANYLLSIINKISHAISTDETRINLNGIYLQQLDSKLRSVAIDGHRLALYDIIDFESSNQTLLDGFIIPKKGVFELKKLAEANLDSDLNIYLDESFIHVVANEETYLSVRLIAREYPKYQTVIPNKTTYTLTVERELILNAVKRIKLLSNEKTNGVKVSLTSTEMTISADHPSLGFAVEKVPVSYNGTEMEIGFNAKYLLDTLNILAVNEIVYELNNELSPVVVRSSEEENFLGIIMPLKI